MIKFFKPSVLAAAALLLAACGGGSGSTNTSTVATSTAHGTLSINPPFRVGSLDVAAVQAELNANPLGAQILPLTGAPVCGVDVYYLRFWTVGGAGETTESSGALMVPTGAAATCTGGRPIVEYAHATEWVKARNLADLTDPTNSEGLLLAAMFAAHGYIVVAPNYAGYDISTLGYHPYLNAQQQSGEMMDILAAARAALPNTLSSATSDNGKLFLTGYSEGGHVAMATLRAMEAAHMTVTAAAPMSGPYAVEALFDAVVFGSVDIGSTEFLPFLTTSWQKAYGNLYSATTDIYSSTYATGIDTLMPSQPLDALLAAGKVPQTYLFDGNTPQVAIPNQPVLSAELTALLAVPSDPTNPLTPLFDAGFSPPGAENPPPPQYLTTNGFRVAYAVDAATDPDHALPPNQQPGLPPASAAPTQPFRLAAYKNDLRNPAWMPTAPVLMCGGSNDPTIYFNLNAQVMQAFWANMQVPAALVTVLDINGTPAAGSPFAPLQVGYQTTQAQTLSYYEAAPPNGLGLSPAAAQAKLVQGTHGGIAPFCTAAARGFFSQF